MTAHAAAPALSEPSPLSEQAQRRILSRPGEPLFLADWDRALFLHFAVAPDQLQPHVPFPLDLRNGRAFVSLVAFTMRHMRLRAAGRAGKWIFRPIATHPFLNVRTYVRHRGERGILFLAEWLPNRLACLLGPPVFGLPYHYGDLEYRHPGQGGPLAGQVKDKQGRPLLDYRGNTQVTQPCRRAAPGSEEEFLLERYTAFTASRKSRARGFFRVWHEPWSLHDASVELTRRDILALAPGGEGWGASAKFAGADFSPGARDVWMGRPHGLQAIPPEPGSNA